jgi:hypothetical protein
MINHPGEKFGPLGALQEQGENAIKIPTYSPEMITKLISTTAVLHDFPIVSCG